MASDRREEIVMDEADDDAAAAAWDAIDRQLQADGVPRLDLGTAPSDDPDAKATERP